MTNDVKTQKKEKSRGWSIFWLCLRRTLICLLVLVLFTVGSAYALCYNLANGPSDSLRAMLVLSAKQASATKWVPGLFLDDATIEEIMANSKKTTVTEIDMNDFVISRPNDDVSDGEVYDEWAEYPDGVRLDFVQGSTFRAYITTVRDPSRVFVGVADGLGSAARGMTIFTIAEKYDALVCTNAGEYPDNGSSTGNQPIGVTFSQGKCVWEDWSTDRTFIGIDVNDRLVVSEGMTRARAEELQVRDGVCFQWGNVLITNEDGKVQAHYSEGNVGAAQRTALGQRADGTIVMAVTDGRSASSIGASRNDIINLMLSQGCVVAGMLDGGTSTLMFYENYLELYGEKYNINEDELDQYQLQGIVNKYKAFIPPRTMPTYICVSKSTGEE